MKKKLLKKKYVIYFEVGLGGWGYNYKNLPFALDLD